VRSQTTSDKHQKMKYASSVLYSPIQVGEKVCDYSEGHSTPLPKPLLDYHARLSATREDADMLSSIPQSQLNVFLARALGAKRGPPVLQPEIRHRISGFG
jgi:hypothetical protein